MICDHLGENLEKICKFRNRNVIAAKNTHLYPGILQTLKQAKMCMQCRGTIITPGIRIITYWRLVFCQGLLKSSQMLNRKRGLLLKEGHTLMWWHEEGANLNLLTACYCMKMRLKTPEISKWGTGTVRGQHCSALRGDQTLKRVTKCLSNQCIKLEYQ